MITIENFQRVLIELGFTENRKVFSKSFTALQATFRVDYEKQELLYPNEITVHDRSVCNFRQPENFVVFECVHRLIEKGYRPENIELARLSPSSNDGKSNKANICVYDSAHEQIHLIIECKTAGQEYTKALKQLKTDGGQLFLYWQQVQGTQWIALYTSDWKNGELTHKNDLICCSDDANIVQMAEKASSVRLYREATTAPQYFEAWTETYAQHLWQGMIFGNKAQAYQINIRPLCKKDLKDFAPEDKIVNRFEEILRHNNVSDKENAFNRLVALLICKLEDEIKKQDDDEVEFQYKQGTDTYATLLDRLQRLHSEGMKDFMGEEIFYVSDAYAEHFFENYSPPTHERTVAELTNTIRALKFYSNNDFAFKDIHNEELFFQNGKILVEVVQLFEKYRIVYPSKQQFLGDFFEQLLNKGFKQNEGQFFTPTPITRFIWDSLPLTEIPKVIDYACGAGHFLTEAVESINSRLATDKNNPWIEQHIFGIEKDYRLARVAKLSLFMNGAGSGNIIFGDGLDNCSEKQIENNAFDILVANPPYSVSAFKSHLRLQNNSLELLSRISNDGSEIETLFVERIAQLLKPGGIAAVILPASILSNENNSYVGARELLLKNFMLRAVVQLGSRTFGTTGTNTVVLFLEKYPTPPKILTQEADCFDAIIQSVINDTAAENTLLQAYLQKIDVNREQYLSFASESATLAELGQNNYLKAYLEAFHKQNKKSDERDRKDAIRLDETLGRFYQFAKPLEAEKLFYFTLTYLQTTLIVTAPTNNAEQKRFLGYDWSNRKGAEGIHITQLGGLLYDAQDRNASGTIAAAIRSQFSSSTEPPINEEALPFCTYTRLCDILDFTRVKFNKTLKLNPDKITEFTSKYPLVTLDTLLESINGNVTKIEKKEIKLEGKYPVVTQETEVLISGYTDNERVITDLPLIVFGDHSCTFKYLDFPFVRGADGTQLLKSNRDKVITKYLYYVLQTIPIVNSGKYERHFKYLRSSKIPLPPLKVQRLIVEECEKIDAAYSTSRMSMEAYKKRIADVLANFGVITHYMV